MYSHRNTLFTLGLRFNDDVYVSLSLGLLDHKLLEHLIRGDYSDDFVLAPSYLVRETWQIAEFRDFLSICLSNLLHKTEYADSEIFKEHVRETFE